MSAPQLDRCPVCRYSLDGLPSAHRCPECGFEYDEETRVWVNRGFWGGHANFALGAVGFFISLIALVFLLLLPGPGLPTILTCGAPLLIGSLAIFSFLSYVSVIRAKFAGQMVALSPAGIVIRLYRVRPTTIEWEKVARVNVHEGPTRLHVLVAVRGCSFLRTMDLRAIDAFVNTSADVEVFAAAVHKRIAKRLQSPYQPDENA